MKIIFEQENLLVRLIFVLCTWGFWIEVVWPLRAFHPRRSCCLCCGNVWKGSAAHLVSAGTEAGGGAPERMRTTGKENNNIRAVFRLSHRFLFCGSDNNQPRLAAFSRETLHCTVIYLPSEVLIGGKPTVSERCFISSKWKANGDGDVSVNFEGGFVAPGAAYLSVQLCVCVSNNWYLHFHHIFI